MPREADKSSARTPLLLSTLLALIAGIVGGLSTDYLKIWVHFLDISNLHAYILVLGTHKDSFDLQLALVNPGNRQGAMSELTFVYASNRFGQVNFPIQSTIHGVPALLNPGEMRLVTIKGTFPMHTMYENGMSVKQLLDKMIATQSDQHEVGIALHFRALDFRGQRYEGQWNIGSMALTSENVTGWRLSSDALPVFEKRYFSGKNIWLSFPGANVRQH